MKIGVLAAVAGLLIASAAIAQPAPHPAIPSTSQTGGAGLAPGMFVTVTPDVDAIFSQIVGLGVFNNANDEVGTIKDTAYAGSTVKAYIVAVGGVLGVGDRYIAVDPEHLSVAFDANAKKWHANMDATADQLKTAPTFTYPAKS